MIKFKPFQSIEEIKRKGELIKNGQIFPVRIVRSKHKRNQHHIKSGGNEYAFPTRKGYLIFVENNDADFRCAVKVTCYNEKFDGSPYSEGGTCWQGNHGLSEPEFLDIFNKKYIEMNN